MHIPVAPCAVIQLLKEENELVSPLLVCLRTLPKNLRTLGSRQRAVSNVRHYRALDRAFLKEVMEGQKGDREQ